MFNFKPIDSKINKDKHIRFESDEELLKDIETSLRQDMIEDVKQGRRKHNHYLDKKEFAAELVKSKLEGQLTPLAIKMFERLIFHIQRRLFYKDKEMQQECASEAMTIIVANWRTYDIQKSPNAFSYFTTTILNGMAKGWNESSKPGVHIPIEMLYQTDRHTD